MEAKKRLRELRKKPILQNVLNWNAFVRGKQNYYKGMTRFYQSFRKIHWRIYKIFYHAMKSIAKFTDPKKSKDDLVKQQRKKLDKQGYKSWGKTGWWSCYNIPVLQFDWANWDKTQISHIKQKVSRVNPYDYGEKNQKTGVSLSDISYLVNTSNFLSNYSMRYRQFRVSLYSSHNGKGYLTGETIPVYEYHCHHVIPKSKGGTDAFINLVILSKEQHEILHSKNYMSLFKFCKQTKKHLDRTRHLIEQVHGVVIEDIVKVG